MEARAIRKQHSKTSNHVTTESGKNHHHLEYYWRPPFILDSRGRLVETPRFRCRPPHSVVDPQIFIWDPILSLEIPNKNLGSPMKILDFQRESGGLQRIYGGLQWKLPLLEIQKYRIENAKTSPPLPNHYRVYPSALNRSNFRYLNILQREPENSGNPVVFFSLKGIVNVLFQIWKDGNCSAYFWFSL